jgi:opacity protein-like surface antigen
VNRLTCCLLIFFYTAPALATDITLLSGYQFNSDFEIASGGDLPPGSILTSAQSGDDVELDEDVAFSLAVDFVYRQDPTKRMGFYISQQQTEFASNAGLTNSDIDVTHLHFTSMSYYPKGKWEPFVLAGLGAGHFSPDDSTLEDETRFSIQLGAGTNYRLNENFLLRADIRWFATFFDSEGAALCSGGCTVAISSTIYSQVQANLGLSYRF